jgi:hypothetical protein
MYKLPIRGWRGIPQRSVDAVVAGIVRFVQSGAFRIVGFGTIVQRNLVHRFSAAFGSAVLRVDNLFVIAVTAAVCFKFHKLSSR